MLRRGFTLLELMVVIVIIGVLATVAILQYGNQIEKSRSAEVKNIFGSLRTLCGAQYMENGNVSYCNDSNLGVTANSGDVPNNAGCRSSHWFFYNVTSDTTKNEVYFRATRCTGSGKKPDWKAVQGMNLTLNLSSGVDTWDTANMGKEYK